MSVTFAQLVGMHVLDGRAEYVLPADPNRYHNEDGFAMALRLDGVWYQFAEDPDDGYRSGLRAIEIVEPSVFPPGAAVEFAPRTVMIHERTDLGWKRESSWEEGIEMLVVIDEQTGNAICEVGTRNTDDYYPYFVHRWDPAGFASEFMIGVQEAAAVDAARKAGT